MRSGARCASFRRSSEVPLHGGAGGLEVDGSRERVADRGAPAGEQERRALLAEAGGEAREQNPHRLGRARRRGGEIRAEQRVEDAQACGRRSLARPERRRRPGELEVLLERRGLARLDQQIRLRGRLRPPKGSGAAGPASTSILSSLHHHRGRLDHAGRAHPRLQPELVHRLARHDRDDARRLGDVDLDPREQAVPLHRANDAAKAVPRRQRLVAVRAAQPLDLRSATTRRLAASRSTVILPSRSQRRSVSTLIPSARAASAASSFA